MIAILPPEIIFRLKCKWFQGVKMETFKGLHINTNLKQVEITSCEHLTERILSPFNKKKEK